MWTGSLKRLLAVLAFVLGSSLVASPARAAGEVASITFSPLHLVAPIFEAQGEFRLIPQLGLAAIGGFGRITTAGHRFGVTELGGQVAAYPLDDFRSLQLGAEVLWLHVNGEIGDVTGVASGVAAGPFVGYKMIARGGFTLFVQGGAQYVFAQAEASNSAGDTATASDSTWVVLFNFNLGWSF